MALKLDQKKSDEIVGRLTRGWKKAKADRKDIEIQAMKNLRQYRGVYDPDIKDKLKDGRSKVYPRDTRTKVKGGVAKMMEMMYPAEGKNWSVKPTVVPNISKDDLNTIIDTLNQQVEAANAEGQELIVTSDMIENAVFDFAKKRAGNMEKECEDQLSEMPTPDSELSKIALRGGWIYGIGYTKGPMVTRKTIRTWERNELTGEWEEKTKSVARPLYRPASFWDVYPDLAAPSWADQSQIYEKLPFSKAGLRKLVGRAGIDDKALKKYIVDNREGNYVKEEFEDELDILNNTQNVADKNKRKYEVISFRGFLTAQDLEEMGVEVPDKDKADQVLVEIWVLDKSIIKLDHTPFGDSPADFYHAYVHGSDEDSGLIGIGLPEDTRDAQLSICATARMMQDNGAAVSGPIWEVNEDLLARGVDTSSIQSFSVVHRNGFGQDAQVPAVRQLSTDSHLTELLALQKQHRDTMDIDSSLPAVLFGATEPVGEAFRTTSNMSMLQSGASMITKDHVRAFDRYVESKIGSLIKWNQRFNKKEEIQGDFEAQPLGSRSLVAKELRGAALNQMWVEMDPRRRAMYDEYGIEKDLLEARDIPTDRLKPRDQAEAAVKQIEEAAAAAAQVEAGLTQAKTDNLNADTQATAAETEAMIQKLPAEMQEMQTAMAKNLADAKQAGDQTRINAISTVMKDILPTLQNGQQAEVPQLGGGPQAVEEF
jgi:hypothetical protein